MSSFKTRTAVKLCIHCGFQTHSSKCKKCGLWEFNAKVQPLTNNRIKNIYVISLKKDSLRLISFFNNLKKMKVNSKNVSFNKFEAIDGSDYKNIEAIMPSFETPVERVKSFWEKNPGSTGCYFSHLKLWKNILEHSNEEFSLIMEDDAFFTPNGLINIELALAKVANTNWDMMYIGHNMLSGKKIHPLFLKPRVGENKRGFNSGLFGYIVRKSSLPKLIGIVQRFDYPFVDVQLRAFFGEGPHRVSALFVTSNLIRHLTGKSSRKTIDNRF